MKDDDLLMDAALDDELDAAASLALQRRLDSEPALKAKWDERRALRAALRGKASYHAAPDELRARLDGLLGLAPTGDDTKTGERATAPRGSPEDRAALAEALLESRRPHPRRRPLHELKATRRPYRPWGYAAGGAIFASLVTLALVDPAALHLPGARNAPERLALAASDEDAAEAVSAHTRAMLVDHPIEVASSDQHTVRPWLSARLNFVPPVVDFAPQGYVLLGARRDVLAGETAAALVYRHGAHVISVFVRPVAGVAAGASTPLVIRGFNVVQRTRDGMAFCLVSDLNPRELAALADLLAPAS